MLNGMYEMRKRNRKTNVMCIIIKVLVLASNSVYIVKQFVLIVQWKQKSDDRFILHNWQNYRLICLGM